MSSSQTATMNSKTNSSIDQHGWVIHIRRTLDEELEDETSVPVCIFNVPKTLMASKPDCYIPQQVAIGPYHSWRPELYEMERYKAAAAKRTQKQLPSLKLENLVEKLMKHEGIIRAWYHKYLEFNGEMLAWMVAVDACFLIEFLQIYAIKDGKVLTEVMSHLVGYAGRKSAQNAVLRDIMMLENQIPLFILRKVLEFQYSSLDAADDLLHSMLMGLCKELSPFKMMEDFPSIRITDCAHLLDSLYQTIVPKPQQYSEVTEVSEVTEFIEDQNAPNDGNQEKFKDSSDVKKVINGIWELISKSNKSPVRSIKRVLLSRPVKLVVKLPWKLIIRVPLFSMLKQPVEYLFFNDQKEDIKPENGISNFIGNNKPLLLEEITIPSVSELYESGIRFEATKGDITTVSFDAKAFIFQLPSVSLDVNTEVVLRNLVAYEEANSASGSLVFTRYVELMNGIIDTEEDVKLLREKGILLNHLKSDKEVANLWNGMSKSIRLTKVASLDKVIEDVNKYYSGRWNVRAKNYFRNYVLGSWQFLTFLAAILMLLLTTLQAFCSVYSCPVLAFCIKDSIVESISSGDLLKKKTKKGGYGLFLCAFLVSFEN